MLHTNRLYHSHGTPACRPQIREPRTIEMPTLVNRIGIWFDGLLPDWSECRDAVDDMDFGDDRELGGEG